MLTFEKPHEKVYLKDTALHAAARSGLTRCVQLLLDHGARTDLRNSRNETAVRPCSVHTSCRCVRTHVHWAFAVARCMQRGDSQGHCRSHQQPNDGPRDERARIKTARLQERRVEDADANSLLRLRSGPFCLAAPLAAR